jgi:uncharacterized membrane protein YcaP (DUF421 family)
MFSIELTKILEILARVSIIYIGCFTLIRLSGRREMSELGPMDLLTMLLLSEVVSPALTGGDETVTGGLIAASALIGLGVLTSWLSVRSKRMDELLQGSAKLLIRDGKVNAAIMRSERITDQDLRAALHQRGLMNVKDVARAYVEADGEITIVKREDLDSSRERFHAHAS